MRLKHTLLIATFLTFASPALADDYVVMKVNNQDITSSQVQRMWEGLFPAGQAPAFESAKPEIRERVLRAVMAERIVYGEAVKAGADKSEKLLRELEDVKHKLVVRNFLDTKTGDMITDAAIKKEYDALVASSKDEKEVRARHILLASEADAKEAKKKLDAGKSFEEVAKEMSKDPGSAAKGGDLGFFTKDKMVPEFANAAFAMKKGEVSGPVKSNFGFHIIKVEDSRKVPAPTLAEVKDQLKGKLQEKKLNDYVSGLVKSAEVKVFDAKGKEVAFSKDLPTEGKPEDAKPAAGSAAPKAADSKAEPAAAAKKPE